MAQDVTPPSTPVVTDEGAFSADQSVTFSWSASDAESGISNFEVSLGTTPTVPQGTFFFNVGTSTSTSLSGLTQGQQYFLYVRAVNGQGLTSSEGISDGIVIDTTPANSVSVTDDGTFTTSDSVLNASFSATDSESSVASFEFSVGTSAGATNVVASSNTTGSSAALSGLSLSSGTQYFFNVVAINGSGLRSGLTSADGILSDFVAPTAVSVTDDGAFTSSNILLDASWTSTSEGHSGLSHYEVSIGTTAGATNVLATRNVGTSTAETLTGLSLTDGQDYFINVLAIDNAGNRGPVSSSDGITVDTSGPTTPTVTDAGEFTGSTSRLEASWTASTDSDSGINRYEVSVGTSAGDTSISDWSNAGVNLSRTITGLSLSHGQSYFINVRAFNNSEVVSSVGSSDGITVDTTNPGDPVITDEGEFKASLSALSFNWTSAEDVSNTPTFSYTLGTTAGANDVVTATEVNGTTLSLTGLSLTNGGTYFLNVTAFNSVGLSSGQASSDGILVDVTAPDAVASVTDQGDFVTSNTTLLASWAVGADAESGIASYEVAVGTTAGGTDVQAFTDVGNVLTSTLSGLSLSNGQTYFISVKAVNGAGLKSLATSSDGIIVDTSDPSAPVVTDDGDFTRFSDSLSATWEAATDSESAIVDYAVSIGTTAGGVDIQDFVSVGTDLSETITGLSLTHGSTYFINVRATNGAGLTAIGSSDGITVDTTPPDTPTVVDTGVFVSSNTTVSFNYSSGEDVSAVSSFIYAIGTTSGATDVLDFTPTTATQILHSGLSLTDGQDYFFSVRAINSAGNTSNVGVSDGVTADGSAPVLPVVTDDGEFTTTNSQLRGSWTLGTDAHSGILDHEFSIGTTPGATDVLDYVSIGSTTNRTQSGLSLTEGDTYFINIRATNGALLRSVGTSNGITVVTTPPTTPNVLDQGAYSTSSQNLSFSWTSTENISGILGYRFSMGTSAGATDLRDWVSTTNTSVSFTNLNLSEGITVFLNVVATSNAGLVSDVGSSDGIIIDTTAPSLPQWDVVTPNHESNELSWTNPSESDFFGLIIRRSELSTPNSITAGDEVLHVTGNSVTTNVLDELLTNGVTYNYSIFAYDRAGNFTVDIVATRSTPIFYEDSAVIDEDRVVTESATFTDRPLQIGFNREVEVTINQTIAAKGAIIGVKSGTGGTVVLPTQNAGLTLNGDLTVAKRGTANVEQASGNIIVSGNMIMGETTGSSAHYSLSDGLLAVSGDIRVGDGTASTFNLSGGTLKARSIAVPVRQQGGDLIIDARPQRTTMSALVMSGTSAMTLILPETGVFLASIPTAALTVENQFEITGTLNVVIPGFDPDSDTSYQLFGSTANLTGTFDAIELPDPGVSNRWVTSNIYLSGSIELEVIESEAKIIGRLLNYPNPVQFSRDTFTRIGYELNKDVDTEIRLYTMFGHEIYKKSFIAGVDEGAMDGYNRVRISEADIGQSLPAGIYVYIVIAEGKVLGRGKMAVHP